MSLWNCLPVALHGALWETGPYGEMAWHWVRDGKHYTEFRRSSTDWALFDPIADAMSTFWSWWILTGRDEDLKADRPLYPWKMGDTWYWVGAAAPNWSEAKRLHTVEVPPL